MWVVEWNDGIEAYGTSEDARFAYLMLRDHGCNVGIVYRRTYLY